MSDHEISPFQYASAIYSSENSATSLGTRVITLPNGQQLFMAALADVSNNTSNMTSVGATAKFLYVAESLLTQPNGNVRLTDAFTQAFIQADAAIKERRNKAEEASLVSVVLKEDGTGLIAHVGSLAGTYVTNRSRAGRLSVDRFITPSTPKEGELQPDEAKQLIKHFHLSSDQLLLLFSRSSNLRYMNWRDILEVLSYYHQKGSDWLDRSAQFFTSPKPDRRIPNYNASAVLVRPTPRR